jgi:hypothetical protein
MCGWSWHNQLSRNKHLVIRYQRQSIRDGDDLTMFHDDRARVAQIVTKKKESANGGI